MKNQYLSHVDTLYLYYKCSHEVYKHALHFGGFDEAPMIGFSKGYDWYDFDIARIGVMDYDKALASNTYPIVIQYNATYLMTINVEDVHLFFLPEKERYIIKRIDYAYTFNTASIDFDFINDICVSKYFRKSSLILGSDRKVETLYLGLRRTGKVFRLYNKSKELDDKKNHEKQQILYHHFGTLDNLFVYEIELHRKYLRDRCGVNSLAELDKVADIVYTLFTSLQFCKDTKKNRDNIKNKHYDRVTFVTPFVRFMEFDTFEFLPVKQYKKSKDFLVTQIDAIIKQYNDKKGGIITPEELLASLYEKNNDDKIIEMEIVYDNYREKDIG
jgi:hypothetical protein